MRGLSAEGAGEGGSKRGKGKGAKDSLPSLARSSPGATRELPAEDWSPRERPSIVPLIALSGPGATGELREEQLEVFFQNMLTGVPEGGNPHKKKKRNDQETARETQRARLKQQTVKELRKQCKDAGLVTDCMKKAECATGI